jgi:hypothetical protein
MGGSSIAEVLRSCGAGANGDQTLEFLDNLVLWNGVSSLFTEAFKLAQSQVNMAILPPILVLTEPRRLALPIARHVRSYARPHWLPVVLLPKKGADNARRGDLHAAR